MTVLVVHPISDRSLDISPARSFGEFAYVSKRYIYIDELEADNQIPTDFYFRMMKAVDTFDVEKDYLLIAGDHLQLIQMSALLAERWGMFRVLRYDREAKGYCPIWIQSDRIVDEKH